MADIRLRPKFREEVNCNAASLLEVLSKRLQESESNVRGAVYKSSCVLRVPVAEIHFWSPQLEVSVDADGEEGTILHGIYGPRPAVWSMFIALYVGVGFLGAMGVIFGYSQMLLGNPAWAYWAGPIAIALALIIYFVARTGRRLGYNQMVQLRTFLNKSISAASTDS